MPGYTARPWLKKENKIPTRAGTASIRQKKELGGNITFSQQTGGQKQAGKPECLGD
jgi:hypothetical protein